MADVLTETGAALVDPLLRIWQGIVSVLPGLLGAVVILIVGYILAIIIGGIVKKLCQKLDLDKWVFNKTNLGKVTGNFSLSAFFGSVVKWLVFVMFWPEAAKLIQLQALSELLTRLAIWVPNLIGAIVIAMIGFVSAEYIAKQIIEHKVVGAYIIAPVLKAIILIVAALIALNQIGLNVSVAENSFLIVLGGIMLAVAIGFGLALKGEAGNIIKVIKKKL